MHSKDETRIVRPATATPSSLEFRQANGWVAYPELQEDVSQSPCSSVGRNLLRQSHVKEPVPPSPFRTPRAPSGRKSLASPRERGKEGTTPNVSKPKRPLSSRAGACAEHFYPADLQELERIRQDQRAVQKKLAASKNLQKGCLRVKRYVESNLRIDKGIYDAVVSCNLKKARDLREQLDQTDEERAHSAILTGNNRVLRELLRIGINPDYEHIDWSSPDGISIPLLHTAIEMQNTFAVDQLLLKLADPNGINSKKFSCMHVAAQVGNLDVMTALVAKGARSNVKNIYGQTPLHLAVLGGHEPVVRYLLSRHAHVDATDIEGRTPLFYAAGENSLAEMLGILINNRATLNLEDGQGWMALHYAASRNASACVTQLLSKFGVRSINSKRVHAYDVAMQHSAFECCSILIENEKSKEAIHSRYDSSKAVVRNDEHESGSGSNKPPAFNALRQVDANGNLPLHHAIQSGQIEFACNLVQQGVCNWRMKGAGGNTVLHMALQMGDDAISRHLLEEDPGLLWEQNDNGSYPVHVACAWGRLELLENMLQLHAAESDGSNDMHADREVNAVLSALLDAVIAEEHTVQVPVEVVARVDTLLDDRGRNLLLVAASRGDLELLHLLMHKHSFSWQVQDHKGYTLLHLLVEKKRYGIAWDFLQELLREEEEKKEEQARKFFASAVATDNYESFTVIDMLKHGPMHVLPIQFMLQALCSPTHSSTSIHISRR